MSSFEDQNTMKTVLERLLGNKHLDLIIFCVVFLGFITMLIISAASA